MTELVDIVLAEDDPDDCLFIRRALEANNVRNEIRVVEDGVALLEYLRSLDQPGTPLGHRRPGLILLDLNMPRKGGREALREIKNDPDLRSIPIVILSTSDAERDVDYSYANGANAYLTKPESLQAFIEAIGRLDAFWLKVVRLPGTRDSEDLLRRLS